MHVHYITLRKESANSETVRHFMREVGLLPILVRLCDHANFMEVGLDLVILGPDTGRMSGLKASLATKSKSERAHVHVRGIVGRSEVISAIARAAAVVLPSLYEGLPTVLLEAAGLGIPFLTTTAGGSRFLVESIAIGFGFTSGERRSFRESLHEAVSVSTSARIQAAEHVRSEYSWPSVADRVIGVYKEVLCRE